MQFRPEDMETAETVNGPWLPYEPGKPMLRHCRVKPEVWEEAWLDSRTDLPDYSNLSTGSVRIPAGTVISIKVRD